MDTFLHDIAWVLPWRSPAATQVFTALSLLGYTEFFLVMLPLGYWLWDKALFTRLAVLIGAVGLTNFFLKDLFQDPRPVAAMALDGRVGESFGFPSGHAQIATAMWLWLAYEMRRAWAWPLAILIAAGVGLSRIYLGVHDVEDVLGGTLIGLATIVIFAGFLAPEFKAWLLPRAALRLALVAALAPLAYVIWPHAPFPVAMFALVGFLFFWLLGRELEPRFVAYRRPANWFAAGALAIVGVVVLFGLMKLIGDALQAAGLTKDHALAVQFAFSALYVTLLAPAAFRFTGLSPREAPA